MAGAQVVIDPRRFGLIEDEAVLQFFELLQATLLAAEAAATSDAVSHYPSKIGTDRTPGRRLFRAKVAQEKLIEASGVPYTILHPLNQFPEFLPQSANSTPARNSGAHSPRACSSPSQPERDVAALRADVALAAHGNSMGQIPPPRTDAFQRKCVKSPAIWKGRMSDPRRRVSARPRGAGDCHGGLNARLVPVRRRAWPHRFRRNGCAAHSRWA